VVDKVGLLGWVGEVREESDKAIKRKTKMKRGKKAGRQGESEKRESGKAKMKRGGTQV
jgi:hypothetical protein